MSFGLWPLILNVLALSMFRFGRYSNYMLSCWNGPAESASWSWKYLVFFSAGTLQHDHQGPFCHGPNLNCERRKVAWIHFEILNR